MATSKSLGEVNVGVTAPSTPSSGHRVSCDESVLSAAAALLWKGVRVITRQGRPGTNGGFPRYGILSLTEESIDFTTKGTRTNVTQTRVSSIREVGLELQTAGQGQEISHVCRVVLKDGHPDCSFSFVCRDAAIGFRSSELTEIAALVIQTRYDLAPKTDGLVCNAVPTNPLVYRMTSFADLLMPLGLVDKYLGAFEAARVHFENLGLVTRDDLANLMGVTDRVDQINIFGLINRRFRGAPPSIHPTELDRSHAEFVGLPKVAADLETGLRVFVRSDGLGKGGVPEIGTLSLTEDRVVVSAQMEGEKAARTARTKISSIRHVQAGFGQEMDQNVCLVVLKEGEKGCSFNFSCMDAANGLSSSEVTKLVVSILRQRLNMAPKNGGLIEHDHLSTPFAAKLLEPLGLIDKYSRAFVKSGIRFENLGVVTRDDLSEVVGVADCAEQINILGQIQRLFQRASPPALRCSCHEEKSSGQSSDSGMKQAKAVGVIMAGIVG